MKRFVSMVLVACLLLAVCLPANALTAADFSDIPDNWAKPAIEYCLGKGLMSGVGNGKFNPGGTVNRAQIAQVLYNREGSPSTEGLENPFTDISGQWFTNAVIWCKNNGVVSGNSATTFNPTGNVTRQDICVMVYRYVTEYKKLAAELTDESKMSGTFTDWGKVAGYAKEAIRWANKVGFMSGTSATTLAPTGQATRAQLAQFLKNLDKVLENEKPEPSPSPEPEKCEHGNDPDTCLICHPEEPQYPGSYRENVPFEETTTVFGLTGEQGAFLPQSDDPSGNALFQKNNVSKCTQANADATRRNLDNAINSGDPRYQAYYNSQASIIPEGHSYRNFVPYGGWVENGSTYTVDIGGHTYTKATEGSTIYNRFGVDVTSVDGVMSDAERKMMVMLQDISYYRKAGLSDRFGDDPTLVYDPCLQMVAEAALQETIENADNLAKAGMNPAQCGGTRVVTTRNAVEASKKYNLSKSKIASTLISGDDTEMYISRPLYQSADDFLNSYEYKTFKTQYGDDLPEDAIRMMWGDDYDPAYAHTSKECTDSSIDYDSGYDMYDSIAMEYFGGWQVNSQYNAEHGTSYPYCLETHNMKGISIRSSLSGIDYSTCAFMCQVPGTNFSSILLGSTPAKFSWNDELRQASASTTSCNGLGISRVGIAYDEDANQWCIVVSGSYKQKNYETGTSNGSAGGAFGHDTTDPESNMKWWDTFVSSEATEW